MEFSPSPRAAALLQNAEVFFETEILPRHREWVQAVCIEGKPAPFLEYLKTKTRAQGL